MLKPADSLMAPLQLGQLVQSLASAGELQGLDGQGVRGNGRSFESCAGLVPRHLSYDSRDVTSGTLFFCKGAAFKPEYLAEAKARGAIAYVAEAELEPTLPGIIVSDSRRAMALSVACYYREMMQRLAVIGITGTKGKSTTAYFIKSVLDEWMLEQGLPETAILSSIDNYDGVGLEESHLTTKESLDLYRHFANAVASGISHLTMEASSQGFKYNRSTSVPFTVGCFLNFGRDHISEIEHPDSEDYLAAKLKIFSQSQTACVNLGTAELDRVLAAAGQASQLIRFGWDKGADIRALGHTDLGKDGLAFTADVLGEQCGFNLGLAGDFNVVNALAAIAATVSQGVPLDIVARGLAKARVPGRMEPFQTADGKLVLVDYAHNQMSFEALFATVKASYPKSHVAIVFGCPGYKAYDRRHDLGSIAGALADDVVLTEEDAGSEPPLAICEDIASHVRAAGGQPRIILDRQEAIESAIEAAPAGAVILVTGKGRETRQKRGTEYIEVPSDTAIVEAYIERLR